MSVSSVTPNGSGICPFQIGSKLAMASGARVVLISGALPGLLAARPPSPLRCGFRTARHPDDAKGRAESMAAGPTPWLDLSTKVTAVSRTHGTRRIREDTRGHDGAANHVQEATEGTAGARKDTPLCRFGTVRRLESAGRQMLPDAPGSASKASSPLMIGRAICPLSTGTSTRGRAPISGKTERPSATGLPVACSTKV
jgi:hypothetical protein